MDGSNKIEGSGKDLTNDDVYRIVKILGDVAGMDAPLIEKKQHLLSEVSQLISADCWIWTLLAPTPPGQRPTVVGLIHGGFSEERLSAYFQALEHPDMGALNAPFLAQVYQTQSHTTRLRQQIDPENTFVTMPVYQLWQKADIAPLILSCHPFDDGSLSFIGLYRNEQAPLFDEREARIAHVILSQVAWLHAESWPGTPKAGKYDFSNLSPRLRTVLNLLLEGMSRKQIASHLAITENTVSEYVKNIYRFFEVHSHAELMKHFRYGDGGDVPI